MKNLFKKFVRWQQKREGFANAFMCIITILVVTSFVFIGIQYSMFNQAKVDLENSQTSASFSVLRAVETMKDDSSESWYYGHYKQSLKSIKDEYIKNLKNALHCDNTDSRKCILRPKENASFYYQLSNFDGMDVNSDYNATDNSLNGFIQELRFYVEAGENTTEKGYYVVNWNPETDNMENVFSIPIKKVSEKYEFYRPDIYGSSYGGTPSAAAETIKNKFRYCGKPLYSLSNADLDKYKTNEGVNAPMNNTVYIYSKICIPAMKQFSILSDSANTITKNNITYLVSANIMKVTKKE